jgi:hypothetical protein
MDNTSAGKGRVTLDGLLHAASRIAIRLSRIALGCVLFAVAIVIYWSIPEVWGTPLAQLTLSALFWSFVGWGAIVTFCTFAWTVAFGPGPTTQ